MRRGRNGRGRVRKQGEEKNKENGMKKEKRKWRREER